MKITIMMTFFFGSLMVSNSSFASGELNQVLKTEETKQSTSKKRRRKKVQMCHDCGKPEAECECEGEGHGVDHEGHDH